MHCAFVVNVVGVYVKIVDVLIRSYYSGSLKHNCCTIINFFLMQLMFIKQYLLMSLMLFLSVFQT